MAHSLARALPLHAAAASAPTLDHDDHDDHGSLDATIALELQRFYEAQEAQQTLDETVAYSITLDEAHRLHDERDDTMDGTVPQCVCCLGTLPRQSQRRVVPCGHVYCVHCVTTRCHMAVRDRSLAPAHCCKKEFPDDYVREVLTQAEWTTYERFVRERVVAEDGTAVALVSDAEYTAAVAAHCGKQCPTCGVGVEKISGCDAMRCLRGHLFCFGCGAAPCQCGSTNLAHYGYEG